MSNHVYASVRSWVTIGLVGTVVALPTLSFVGCERKEKVIDVETPAGEIEVERNIDTGEVDVEIQDN